MFCAVRAVVKGYVPLDDNGVTETRARDVFGSSIPLIGTVSSASQIGTTVNHPGPMLFDVLAIPVRLLPHGAGVALGVAAIHIAVVAAILWCSRRLLGEHGACLIVATIALLIWSMGSEALFEVWQPVVPMLPFLLALVAAWGFAAGRDELAIPAVLAISFVVQTHGSYLLLGPAVLTGAVACRFALRAETPVARRPLVVAGVAGFVVWLQPIIDQLFRSHNMSALLTHATSGEEGRALGFSDAVRAAATVLVKPPLWTRPGMASSLPNSGGMVGTAEGRTFDPDWMAFPMAAVGIAALLGALIAAAVVARRRHDQVLLAGGVIGAVAVVAAIVSLAGLPIDAFGFTAHKARWLWPIGAYLTAFGFVVLLRFGVPRSPRQAVLSVTLAGAVALAATLPTSFQYVSPAQYETGSQDAARELRESVSALEGRGVVFLDLSRRAFPDVYNDTIAAEMATRGIRFRVAGEYVTAQYGEQRRLVNAAGADVTVRVFLDGAAAALPDSWDVRADIPDGLHRVVLAVTDGIVLQDGAPSG